MVVVLIGLLAAFLLTRGSSEEAVSDKTSSGANSTATNPSGTEAGGEAPGDTTVPDNADELTEPGDPSESTPAGPSESEPAPAAGADACVAESEALLQAVKSYEPLADYADRLTITDPRCVDRWATAVASAPDTDESLVVYERKNDTWMVLLVGAAEPCSGLGIPPEVEPRLGCDAF